MKIKLLLFMLCSALLLTGCGPYNPYYPERIMLGNVINGHYTVKIGNRYGLGCFRVMVPQHINLYEHEFLDVQESYGTNYTYVRFGPEPTDATIYRVMVGYKGKMSMEKFRTRCFALFIDQVARGYDRQMDKIFETETMVDCHPAIYQVYTQNTQGLYQYYNAWQRGDITLTHAIYFIDYGKYGAVIWIQYSSDSFYHTVNYRNRCEIIDQTWMPQIRFMRSFGVFH